MKIHNVPLGALIQSNSKSCRNLKCGSGTACLSALPLAALLVSSVFARPAGAVTLRQQWVPGQQLTYETTVGGKMTLLADDASPQPWAGLPIDFRVRGSGALGLDTLSVAPDGIGTVALSSGDGRVRALGFGQVMEMNFKDGVATALLNGKPLMASTSPLPVAGGTPPKPATNAPANASANASSNVPSKVALRLAPDGHIVEVITLPGDKKEPASGVTANGLARTAVNTAASMAGVPFFDFSSLAQSWFVRALPAFWPAGNVEEGAQWTVPLTIPLPAAKNGTAPTVLPAPINVGKATLTLRGTEEISGRKTRRVGLQGSMEIDAAKAKILNDAARSASEKNEAGANAGSNAGGTTAKSSADSKTRKARNTSSLANARQTMSGDLWLDTASGQVVRADVTLVGKMHSKGEITNKAGKTRPTETWADFDVSLQMLLRKISYASPNAS